MGRYGLPTLGLNILGVGLAGPTLIEHGNEEQKQRYLRKILSSRGDLVPAVQRAGRRLRPRLRRHPRRP